MSQSRVGSLVEALANTVTGFGLGIAINMTVLPVLGLPISVGQSSILVTVFTVVSLARSYLTRRFFNYIQRRSHVPD